MRSHHMFKNVQVHLCWRLGTQTAPHSHGKTEGSKSCLSYCLQQLTGMQAICETSRLEETLLIYSGLTSLTPLRAVFSCGSWVYLLGLLWKRTATSNIQRVCFVFTSIYTPTSIFNAG